MKIMVVTLVISVGITSTGCQKVLTNPEIKDPVFNEIKKQKDKVDADLVQAEKEISKAQIALDEAPIRTGQRQDALDTLFELKHAQQKQIELFRYLSLKQQQRKIQDRIEYAASLESKRPWPAPGAYEEYILEQKLATAPREWSPENRIKDRLPAAKVKKPEAEEGGE